MSGIVKDYFSGWTLCLLSYFVTKEEIDIKEVEQFFKCRKGKS